MAEMESSLFTWLVRVYYEDTDASGVVYHASYLRWFERARSEWLRARGRSHEELARVFGAAFTVAELNIRYLRPARLDQSLLATVAIGRVRPASLIFEQQLIDPAVPVKPLALAQVKVACVDLEHFRPRVWPTGWLDP